MRLGRCLLVFAVWWLWLALPVYAARYATYHINYVYLTLTRVQTVHSLDYSIAPAGTKYLVATFQEVNKDDVQQEITYNDIKAYVAGREIDQSFANPDPALTSIILDPGAHAGGGIAWEVPSGAHSAQLRWAPTPSFSDAHWPTYTWTVRF